MGMFKLKFKKDDCCKITVDVEATECSLDKMKKEALKKAEIDFNKQKRAAITSELKESLLKQYGISKEVTGYGGFSIGNTMLWYEDHQLVAAMIDNMIDDLSLMDD